LRAVEQIIDPGDANMKELIRKLDAEYGFGLTEQEVELIARQSQEMSRLYQRLYEVDSDQSSASREQRKAKE
jgi:hypothetical protein